MFNPLIQLMGMYIFSGDDNLQLDFTIEEVMEHYEFLESFGGTALELFGYGQKE